MIVKEPKFEISAVGPKQYPSTNFPEVVLVGKSNVGKSSFINTLINRKKLAKTSSEPGKTRQINFYNIDSKFYFVDLPGYGYSKMSKKEQVIVGNFIEEYLHKRKQIALIIFLVDISEHYNCSIFHGEIDEELFECAMYFEMLRVTNYIKIYALKHRF